MGTEQALNVGLCVFEQWSVSRKACADYRCVLDYGILHISKLKTFRYSDLYNKHTYPSLEN